MNPSESQEGTQESDNLRSQTSIVSVLGVKIMNATKSEAIEIIEQLMLQEPDITHSIFLVNAHSLNLATDDPQYKETLNSASRVFGDGSGVYLAAKLRGVTMKSNLVGTDLIPELFQATADCGYRYFLLGADSETIDRAAQKTKKSFPGWELVGFHHGYIHSPEGNSVIDKINAAKPHLLLVGMGNPLQERWIHQHQHELRVPVCVGVGGLFDHWGDNLTRAPSLLRQMGCEWVQILLQQPKKWKRYIIGNPQFILRIILALRSDLETMRK